MEAGEPSQGRENARSCASLGRRSENARSQCLRRFGGAGGADNAPGLNPNAKSNSNLTPYPNLTPGSNCTPSPNTGARTAAKNAVLDLVYAADDLLYPLFRFVLTLEVVDDVPRAEQLKSENLRTAEEIQTLKERAAEATDFLLVSTPTLDLGRVDARKGSEFSFRIQNCSRTAAIPFVVAPNLASENRAIRSTPGDLDVKIDVEAWGEKRTEIIKVPDVRQIFVAARLREF